MNKEISYIERAVPARRTATIVARVIYDERAALETYSVYACDPDGRHDSTRDGIVFREHGKWYAQSCDEYGFPVFPLLRALRMHADGIAAMETFIEAAELLIGHRPQTTIRLAA